MSCSCARLFLRSITQHEYFVLQLPDSFVQFLRALNCLTHHILRVFDFTIDHFPGPIYGPAFDQETHLGTPIDARHLWLRIPMMSISQTDLMPIRSERSDARLSQCEIVIGIRQEFCSSSLF